MAFLLVIWFANENNHSVTLIFFREIIHSRIRYNNKLRKRESLSNRNYFILFRIEL